MSDKCAVRSERAEEQKAQQQPPSTREWRELYDAAAEFKQAECWNWMRDTDLFGVQNPENGEIGYCCIMGRGGEHFALAVYLGTEGLETYWTIRRKGNYMHPFEALLLQKCLMASFEDRSLLAKRDVEVIKALGLKFRGRNSWPLFRSYIPGFVPWHLNREEAKFLVAALQQSVDVARRFKENPEMLNSQFRNRYLVRVPRKEGHGVVWRDEWIEPVVLERKEMAMQPVDEEYLNKIRKRRPQRNGVWEVDFFYCPQAVQEKDERPFYPRIILLVNHSSGLIMGFKLPEPETFASELQKALIETVENLGIIPEEVLVKREETFKMLKPATYRLRIKLRKVKRLPLLEEAQEGFLGFQDERFL